MKLKYKAKFWIAYLFRFFEMFIIGYFYFLLLNESEFLRKCVLIIEMNPKTCYRIHW